MTKQEVNTYAKPHEAWSTLFITEMFSVPLTPLLAALRVNPNLITVFSLISGLTTAFFFAKGQWVAGALLFELSCFFDNIDGKVARIRNMTSEFGAKLETVADVLRKPSSFSGISLFFYFDNHLVYVALTAGAFAVHYGLHKLYGLVGVSEYDLEFPSFHRSILRRIAPRLLNIHNFFDEQFVEFVVAPLLIGICGTDRYAVWFFYVVGAVTLLGLIKMFNSLNYRRQGRYKDIYQNWT